MVFSYIATNHPFLFVSLWGVSPPIVNEPNVIQLVDSSHLYRGNRVMLHVQDHKSKWLWSSLNSWTLLIFACVLCAAKTTSKWNSIFDKIHDDNFVRKTLATNRNINNNNTFLTLSRRNSRPIWTCRWFFSIVSFPLLLPISLLRCSISYSACEC